MSENVTELSPRQKKAIEAILEGKSMPKVSEAVGISRQTLYRWLNQPEFRKELNRLGGHVLEEVANRMVGLASEAVETLSKVLTSKDVLIGNQIQVASVILKRATEVWELYSLSKRIDALEALLESPDGQGK